jgi:hypothetical protein
MRHLGTLAAAIVIAPLAWILLAFGQDRSEGAFEGSLHPGGFLRPALCLAAAGILLGLIGTLRFSPLGAVAAGVGYAVSYLALLVNPQRVVNLFPHHISVLGRSADPVTPLRTGTALIVGALLLVAVASIGRWRRWPVGDRAWNAQPPVRDYALAGADEFSLADITGAAPAVERSAPAVKRSAPAVERSAAAAEREIDNERRPGAISHWVASLRGDFDGGRPRSDRPDQYADRPAPDRQAGYPADPRGRVTDSWRAIRRS